ncbi:AraC family transcriptional regulator [Flavisolibacter tropicus]|uniref:AraC family transcriptional regulator n=1 Tax=Flavisolibacter tropicus TaxID=1492898 RepID=A0A172TWE1_9BACT|nr:AraC family transcriptional regulator [Flavisolibacter tropicus]ANE51409.1 AraC family transcriptional regulator [Flavisolibacter tropicus]
MRESRRRDGFVGEKQILIPKTIIHKHITKNDFLHSLFITSIGYFPNALYHYRERKNGCEDYILLYSLAGKGNIEIGNERFELQPHQFIIIPPHRFHRYQANVSDPWTIYWIHFSSNQLEAFSREFKVEQFFTPTDLCYNDKIVTTWKEMYSSLANGYAAESIGYANFCMYRFLSFFLFPKRKTSLPKKACPFDQSIEYMKANLEKRLTTQDIANHFKYSSSHYTALFKKKTGLSPIDYFIKMKIHYACQLLTQSDLKIKEVAEKIGYEDPYYFSRLFKLVMNKSPKDYRNTSL